MSKRTFIYLHSIESAQASWVRCTNNTIEHSVLRGHLADLSLIDKQNEIIVFIPAHDVLLTQAILPKLNRQRLMQALPYALEEQLINDITELHFAISEQQAGGVVPAAIVTKKKMEEWLALLKQYSILPQQLYSAVFSLPFIHNNWLIHLFTDIAIVRHHAFQGFSCEPDNLPLMWDCAIQATEEKPECIHFYHIATPTIDLKTPFPVNEIALTEETWLEKISATFSSPSAINLLQGAYRPKRVASDSKKIWLMAAYTTLACISLAFFSELVSLIILEHHNTQIETAIETIYRHHFPEGSSIANPRERMQKRLATLQEQTNKNYFLVLLAKIGHPLTQNTGVELKALSFHDDQLSLEIMADKFDDLDALTQAMSQKDLQIKQQNASVVGNKVKATLLVQRGNT